MEFFNKLGKKASAAYKMTADKTGRIAKDTKNKLKMGELKSQIDDLYQEIGKKVYEKHQREEDIDINKELEEQCTKIDVLSDEIDSLLKECLELKDKKQCPKCYKEIEREDKFCPNCGEKQTDEPVKEVEILEDLANAQVEDDNEIEKKIVAEELKDDIEEKQDNKEENEDFKNNLEKTVQIESDIEIDEENEDKE